MQTDLFIGIQGKHRLLIFEDEHSMQTILSEVLMSDKFHVDFVSKDAITIAQRYEPELILLDHNTAPQMDEDNLCQKIKALFPNTPLIVLSAYPLNHFGSYDNHIDLFIAKPFDLTYFLRSIERYLVTEQQINNQID